MGFSGSNIFGTFDYDWIIHKLYKLIISSMLKYTSKRRYVAFLPLKQIIMLIIKRQCNLFVKIWIY